ncbi:unnamed protein product [Pedinophyceae sp. YPF-701]|nr:unnamed protein product [Pedinophyceae sp. YPF-701]
MKKFIQNQKRKILREGAHPLEGRELQVGPYKLRVGVLIAGGGYASVYECTDRNSGQPFALKHVRVNGNAEVMADTQREVRALEVLRGQPSILRLHASQVHGERGKEEFFLLLDLCRGDLTDYVLGGAGREMTAVQMLLIFRQVLQAVAAMHGQDPPMLHRDIKAQNVLHTADGRWVLCDFGSVSTASEALSDMAQIVREEEMLRKKTTPAYRAPELWDLYSGKPVGPKADIWALGCLLYLMCSDQLPFTGESQLEVSSGRVKRPAGTQRATPQVADLCLSMLRLDPAARPDVFTVLTVVDALLNDSGATYRPGAAPGSGAWKTQQQHAQPQAGWAADWGEAAAFPATAPAAQQPAPAKFGLSGSATGLLDLFENGATPTGQQSPSVPSGAPVQEQTGGAEDRAASSGAGSFWTKGFKADPLSDVGKAAARPSSGRPAGARQGSGADGGRPSSGRPAQQEPVDSESDKVSRASAPTRAPKRTGSVKSTASTDAGSLADGGGSRHRLVSPTAQAARSSNERQVGRTPSSGGPAERSEGSVREREIARMRAEELKRQEEEKELRRKRQERERALQERAEREAAARERLERQRAERDKADRAERERRERERRERESKERAEQQEPQQQQPQTAAREDLLQRLMQENSALRKEVARLAARVEEQGALLASLASGKEGGDWVKEGTQPTSPAMHSEDPFLPTVGPLSRVREEALPPNPSGRSRPALARIISGVGATDGMDPTLVSPHLEEEASGASAHKKRGTGGIFSRKRGHRRTKSDWTSDSFDPAAMDLLSEQ